MDQLVTGLAQPFPALWLGAVAGLLVLAVRHRPSRRMALAVAMTIGALGAISTPLAAHVALISLERQYPFRPMDSNDVDALVVLAGGVREVDPVARTAELSESSVARCLFAARLYRESGAKPVIVTGSTPDQSRRHLAAAPLMESLLQFMGVSGSDIVVENASRNTYENARETARVLREHGIERIALVTEATHLPRAVRCFRAQGVHVVPAGCRYRSGPLRLRVTSFVPNASAARDVQVAVHEWLGILWYWLNGRFTAVDTDVAGGAGGDR